MRRLTAALLLSIMASPALAAFPCDELWGERNAIYKDAGYCFRTERAIRAFGNAGCKYDELADVPLSARDRAEIDSIRSMERTMRCAP